MSLEKLLMEQMKTAMKSKDKVALQALRSVKSAILLAKTENGAATELTEDQEMKILQKQAKQRKDSAAIFIEQGRQDLAEPELAELAIIAQFLPEALSEDEIEKVVLATIAKVGAVGMKDMGKVMGSLKPQVQGRTDMGALSAKIKARLNA